MSFVFIVIYRPEPASAVTDMFFVDWADVLERTAAYVGCLIVGDVNLHVDDVASISTERFLTLLQAASVCVITSANQHVATTSSIYSSVGPISLLQSSGSTYH